MQKIKHNIPEAQHILHMFINATKLPSYVFENINLQLETTHVLHIA